MTGKEGGLVDHTRTPCDGEQGLLFGLFRLSNELVAGHFGGANTEITRTSTTRWHTKKKHFVVERREVGYRVHLALQMAGGRHFKTQKAYPVLHGVVHGQVDVPATGPVRVRLLPGDIVRVGDDLPDRHLLHPRRILFESKTRKRTVKGSRQSVRIDIRMRHVKLSRLKRLHPIIIILTKPGRHDATQRQSGCPQRNETEPSLTVCSFTGLMKLSFSQVLSGGISPGVPSQ